MGRSVDSKGKLSRNGSVFIRASGAGRLFYISTTYDYRTVGANTAATLNTLLIKRC